MNSDPQRLNLLQLNYQLHRSDANALLRHLFWKRKQIILVGALLFLACFTAGFLWFKNLDNLVDLLLFACGFAFLFGVFRSVWQRIDNLEQNALNQNPMPEEGKATQLTCSKSGIQVQTGQKVFEFPWDSVQKWIRTKRHLFLILRGSRLAIPMAQIQPESQTALLEILRQRIH